MSIWNWLVRRRKPLRYGTLRETADERGIHTQVTQAYPLPPSLVGPDVQVRPLNVTPLAPTTIISLDARRQAHADQLARADYVAQMLDLGERYWLATEGESGYEDGGDCA